MKLTQCILYLFVSVLIASCTQESRKESQLIDSTGLDSVQITQNQEVNDSLMPDIESVDSNRFENNLVKRESPGTSALTKQFVLQKPKDQVFSILNQKDTIVTAREGTRIYIPQNAFIDAATGNKIDGAVAFSVTEYYKPSDMIAGGLTTQSGDEILETGGMIYISATSRNRKLKLEKNKKLEIRFSSKSKPENEIFYGAESKGKIDWQLSKNNKVKPSSDSEEEFNYGLSGIPMFKGDLEKYLKENIFYPPSVEKTAATGIVYAHFEVTILGAIKGVELEGSIDPLVDKAIFYIVSNMPAWKPALSGTKPITSYYRLPVGIGKSRIARTMRQKQKAALLEAACKAVKVDYMTEGAAQYASKSFNQGNLIRKGKDKELDGVIYELDQMGWINCDRFINFKASMVRFAVDRKGLENFNFFLFVKSMRGIVGPQFNDHTVVFSKIPDQSACLLVAYEIQDKSARFIAQDVVVSKNVVTPDRPEVMSYASFKEELKKINRIWQ